VQSGISYDNDTGSAFNALYTTTFTLNAQGQVTGAAVNDGIPKTVSYVLDGAGQIIRRDESRNSAPSQAAPHELFYRFGGKQKGVVSNNGTLDIAFDSSITQRSASSAPITSSNAGLFKDGTSSGAAIFADFSMSMEAYNTWRQGSAGGTYSVRSGDTLPGIASAVWGDASLWYLIAQANGISGDGALVEGQQLILPAGVTRSDNNAGTFKPYNASDAMGNTSPTTAKPPKKPNCALMLVVAIVAIAMSVWVGPEIIQFFQGFMGSFMGAVVGGAVAGAASSVVSQGVGVAIGAQDSINWKGVGLAALAGGISGGLEGSGVFGKMVDKVGVAGKVFEKGAIGIGSKLVDGLVRGTVTNALTQVAGKALHLQEKFSWSAVATSAIGTLVNHAGAKLGADPITTSGASLLIRSATRSLIDGTDFGDNVMAELPDVIAQTIVGAVDAAIRGREKDLAHEAGHLHPATSSTQTKQGGDTRTPSEGEGNGGGVGSDSGSDSEIVVTANGYRGLALRSSVLWGIGPDGQATFIDTDPNSYYNQLMAPIRASVAQVDEMMAELSIDHSDLGNIDPRARQKVLVQRRLRDEKLQQLQAESKEALSPDADHAQKPVTEDGLVPQPVGVSNLAATMFELNAWRKRAWDGYNEGWIDEKTGEHHKYSETYYKELVKGYDKNEVLIEEWSAIADAEVGKLFIAAWGIPAASAAAVAAAPGVGTFLVVNAGRITTGGILGGEIITGVSVSTPVATAGVGAVGLRLADEVGDFAVAGRAAKGAEARVLFGQKRVGPTFGVEGRPDYLAGRSIRDVANDLRSGVLHPDQLPIDAFRVGDNLVSANTRSLSALSEAGLSPTVINEIQPTSALLRRLRESPIIPNAPLPGPRVPVTPSQSNLDVLRIIELPR
jgi:hypothetical protein